MQFTFADIFAGIGGFRKAFEELGGECVLSIEKNANCRKSQEANFTNSRRHHWHDDIRDFAGTTECDLLCAGFPCQPFSLASGAKLKSLGKPHGFQERNNGDLFFVLAELIDRLSPAAILLENVPALKTHDGGATFKVILDSLERIGYSIHWAILCSSAWVPQKRRRIFIAGFRDDVLFNPMDNVQFPDSPTPILAHILETSVDAKYRFTRSQYKTALRHKKKQARRGNGFGTKTLTPHQQARALTRHYAKGGHEMLIDDTLIDYSRFEVSETKLKTLQAHSDRNRGAGFRAQVFGPDNQTRTLTASGLADGRKIMIDEFDHDSSKYNLIERTGPRRPRKLTPRECARLMGFDEPGKPDWKIVVSDTAAYRQFGNAVVVPLVRAIGRTILPHLVG